MCRAEVNGPRTTHVLIGVLAVLMVMGTACAPATPASSPAPAPQVTAPAPPAPKNLVIGIQSEPKDIFRFSGGLSGGVNNVGPIVHDTLVYEDDAGVFHPLLVAEPISVQNGTWRANPDGTMETTWKLKPGIKWHDGTPFTADDLVFTWTVRRDRAVGIRQQGRVDLMETATAPDPLTFVVRWSSLFGQADRGDGLDPMPKHLLESVYEADKAGFVNSPRLAEEFVGLGPYRLTKWERGSHLEFGRYDEYHRGRPPLDRVTVRFLGNPNTMAANVLSGTVDVLLPEGISVDAALEVQQRWAGTGNEVRFDVRGSIRGVRIQQKPEYARPVHGFTDRAVRYAFYHAIDRQAMAQAMSQGMAPVADSWIAPNSALRRPLESSIPQYPYDPPRAQQLLSQVGWVKGPDGVLVHTATGTRFETTIRAPSGATPEKEQPIVADYWKALGAQVELEVRPEALADDPEYGATFPGGEIVGPRAARFYVDQYWHSRQIASAANRWRGENTEGYDNPRADMLMTQMAATLDPPQQLALHSQLLREMMGDVAIMPTYWQLDPVLAVKGVKTHRVVGGNNATWNFFDWDRP
jgi:peptide/nickel transport system substrate-binding protein